MSQGITIEITHEQLKETFQASMNAMMDKNQYDNPVKRILSDKFGYSGNMKGVIGEKVQAFLDTQMDSPEFQAILGQAIANEMAIRAVDGMKDSKR